MNQLIKNRIVTSCWIAAGVLTIVLLGAASRIKSHHNCVGINVEIKNAEEFSFIGADDITDLININGMVVGKDISSINLQDLENVIKHNKWIKDVQLFFDNQHKLEVFIKQREPVARVFCTDNNSFYIDAKANRLPLTNKASARVLVVTGFTSNRDTLSSPDSVLLKNTVLLANKIASDSFWNAQVAQVNITNKGTFELIPVLGTHIVDFGSVDSMDTKLRKLKAFYKQVYYPKNMSDYTRLNVSYNNQIVVSKIGNTTAVDTAAVLKDSVVNNPAMPVVAKDSANIKAKNISVNNKEKDAKLSVVKQNKPTDNTLTSISKGLPKSEKVNKQPVPKAVMGKNLN